jgi:hypothetical protein
MSALAQALLAFQSDAPDLHTDSENPHFKSKFLGLPGAMDKIRPAVNSVGLIITQLPTAIVVDGHPAPALRTRITHAESGEFIEDVMLLMPTKDDPQAQGSALTYARRYSLMAMLGLVADEDDDGNKASMVIDPKPRSGAGTATAASPAPENPAERARRAQQATGQEFDEERYHARYTAAMAEGAIPSQQVVSFGKNKGVLLGELTLNQLKWYAENWQMQDQPVPYDFRLKAAAVALFRGDDTPEALTPPDDDMPF